MTKVLIKILWKKEMSFVQVGSEKLETTTRDALVTEESITNSTDVFEFNTIRETERIEALFCSDCHKFLKLLLNPRIHEAGEEILGDIGRAAICLQDYLMNTLEGKVNSEYPRKIPILYRQNVTLPVHE